LPARALRYLALGDSLTIGTGASNEHHNFPTQLSRKLSAESGRLVRLTNHAVDGATTDDLIRDQLDQVDSVRPDYVSVLIGANDISQGRGRAEYQGSLIWIYDVIASRGLPPTRVATISIPDWSAVPAGGRFGNPDSLRLVIEGFNAVARTESATRGFVFVDIAELSRSRLAEEGWTSADGLHPGDPQYAAWADHIWDQVREGWRA
jgi:lysophospholipase L1-like esterase